MSRRANNNSEQSFYELIAEHCTSEQIKDLLRRRKAELAPSVAKEITLGANKEETVANLRHAISRNALPFEQAADLLREAEENGRQHIFYFKARTPAAAQKLRRPDAIAASLFGDEFDYMGFPRFERTADKYEWADFRPQYRGKPRDWLAKLYGHETQLKFVNEEWTKTGGLIKRWEPETGRTILIARWNDPDLLELRVDNWNATKKILRQRLEVLMEYLAPAISPSDLSPWDFARARRAIVQDRKTNGRLYQMGSLELLDTHSGRAAFHPRTDDEKADDASDRSKAIDALISGRASCRTFAVKWIVSGSADSLHEDLRTICSPTDSHEVAITSRTSSTGIDYVTDQLRKFDR